MPQEDKGFNLGKVSKARGVDNANAEIAQLVEHNLAKVGVASSSLVFRSKAVICNAQVAEW